MRARRLLVVSISLLLAASVQPAADAVSTAAELALAARANLTACRGDTQCADGWWLRPDLWSDLLSPSLRGACACLESPRSGQGGGATAKRPRLLFMGDSTMRQLYLAFTGRDRKTHVPYGTLWEADANLAALVGHRSPPPINVSTEFLFKGKMMHQRSSASGRREGVSDPDADVHNAYLRRNVERRSERPLPAVLIVGAGMHELLGWDGRPQPHPSVEVFASDALEFLDVIAEYPAVVFVSQNAIRPGKASIDEALKLREVSRAMQAAACIAFKEHPRAGGGGMQTLDFHALTDGRADCVGRGGVHYENCDGQVLDAQARLVARAACLAACGPPPSEHHTMKQFYARVGDALLSNPT